jgi:hypothetical protein
VDVVDAALQHSRPRPHVAALAPRVNVVAEQPQQAAQRPRAQVRRHEAGDHEHRMAVTSRRQPQQRQRRQAGSEFERRARFEGELQPAWCCDAA